MVDKNHKTLWGIIAGLALVILILGSYVLFISVNKDNSPSSTSSYFERSTNIDTNKEIVVSSNGWPKGIDLGTGVENMYNAKRLNDIGLAVTGVLLYKNANDGNLPKMNDGSDLPIANIEDLFSTSTSNITTIDYLSNSLTPDYIVYPPFYVDGSYYPVAQTTDGKFIIGCVLGTGQRVVYSV